MSTNRDFSLIVGFLVALMLPTAPPLVAQDDPDCGLECRICGGGKFEGRIFSQSGAYDMACSWGTQCAEEGCGAALVSDIPSETEELVDIVIQAPTTELAAVIERHSERLLIYPPRNLLAIRGTECDPEGDIVASVMFLSPERMRILEQLRVRRLDDFLRLRGER